MMISLEFFFGTKIRQNLYQRRIDQCMIKIFWGAGVVTPSKPPPPTNNFCLYTPPSLRCFWKNHLMTPPPPPPHFKHLSLLPPFPSTTLLPPKNFDHTPSGGKMGRDDGGMQIWEGCPEVHRLEWEKQDLQMVAVDRKRNPNQEKLILLRKLQIDLIYQYPVTVLNLGNEFHNFIKFFNRESNSNLASFRFTIFIHIKLFDVNFK